MFFLRACDCACGMSCGRCGGGGRHSGLGSFDAASATRLVQAVVSLNRPADIDAAIPLIRARKPVDRARLADLDIDPASLR